jgi:hypothetical protein
MMGVLRALVVLLCLALLLEVARADIDCSKHKVFCKITQLKPKMEKHKAMELSNLMHKYAKEFNQDPILSVAIAMQETSIRQTDRKQSVLIVDDSHPKGWRVVTGYSDICMFQFHINTIINYNLDPIRLKEDINYCVKEHFRLMRTKRKACSNLGSDDWTCYHSANTQPRLIYKKLVNRYL